MIASLRLGDSAPLAIDLPADRLIAACGVPAIPSIDDVAQATLAGLTAPLSFPPLAQAVVPGDRVVLALDHDVPCSPAIISALLQVLIGRGVSASDITLLTVAPHKTPAKLADLVPVEYRDQVTIEIHDPDARDRLGYLAAAGDSESIYLNRLLCDADVAIPIGCLRCEPAIDYHGMYGGLFPTFAGRAAQDKLFAQGMSHAARNEVRCRETIQQVGWLLGVQFTIQVVPGPAGSVLGIFAGDPATVFAEGQAACQRAWAFSVPRPADVVIATVDGPAEQQTWDNIARAVTAAARVVAAEGAIVLCTALADPPGPTVRMIADAAEASSLRRNLRKRRLDDALPALALADVLSEASVYLLSRLDESVVEELGVTPLASTSELSRLAEVHSSCILLSNAQYAVAAIDAA